MFTMHRSAISLVFVGLLLCGVESTLDTRGTEFYVLFLDNYRRLPTLTIIISSERATTVTVQNIYKQTNSTYDVPAMGSIHVDLHGSLAYGADLKIQKKIVYVTSTQDISLHAMNTKQGSTDGYVVLPVNLLSNRYIVASYGVTKLTSGVPTLAMSAIDENTQVRIEFKSVNSSGRCTWKGYKSGETWSGVLNRFEVIGTSCTTDLTGTLITSDKPLVVVSGHKCANVPIGKLYCDHLEEMMIPVKLFGKTFTFHNPGGRTSGAIYRIIASVEETNITMSNGGCTSLRERDFIDIDTNEFGQICVESNKPVLVVSFAKGKIADKKPFGDPFMGTVPSTDILGNLPFLFKMPENDQKDPYKHFITITFLRNSRVRVPQSFQGSIQTIENCDFDVATIPIRSDSDLVTLQSSDLNYVALVYGFSDHGGYAFPGFLIFSGECEKGFYGSNCNLLCSTFCQENTCDKGSGACINGCVPGRRGYNCTEVSDCPTGFYGNKCDIKCSPYCKGDVCERVTGKCLLGCIPGKEGSTCSEVSDCPKGFYGNKCDIKCSPYCKGDVCERVTGKCLLGCIPGKEGSTCSEDCTEGPECKKACINCEGEKCQRGGTACPFGCKPGWTDTGCTAECMTGYYGPDCYLQCSPNCEGGSCHHIDGTCSNGCTSGWKGAKCSQEQNNNIAIIIGVTVGAVVLIGIMLVVAVLVLKRRRRNTQESPTIINFPKQDENVFIVTPQPGYDRLADMGIDNIYESINESNHAIESEANESVPSSPCVMDGKTHDKSYSAAGYDSLMQFTKESESPYTALYGNSSQKDA